MLPARFVCQCQEQGDVDRGVVLTSVASSESHNFVIGDDPYRAKPLSPVIPASSEPLRAAPGESCAESARSIATDDYPTPTSPRQSNGSGVVVFDAAVSQTLVGRPLRSGVVWHVPMDDAHKFRRVKLALHANGLRASPVEGPDPRFPPVSVAWSPFTVVQACAMHNEHLTNATSHARLFKVSIVHHGVALLFATEGDDAYEERARWVADIARGLRQLTLSLFPRFRMTADPLEERPWTRMRLLAGYTLMCDSGGVSLVYCELHAHYNQRANFVGYEDETCNTKVLQIPITATAQLSERVGADCSCFSIENQNFSARTRAERALWLRALSNLKVKIKHSMSNPTAEDLVLYRQAINESTDLFLKQDEDEEKKVQAMLPRRESSRAATGCEDTSDEEVTDCGGKPAAVAVSQQVFHAPGAAAPQGQMSFPEKALSPMKARAPELPQLDSTAPPPVLPPLPTIDGVTGQGMMLSPLSKSIGPPRPACEAPQDIPDAAMVRHALESMEGRRQLALEGLAPEGSPKVTARRAPPCHSLLRESTAPAVLPAMMPPSSTTPPRIDTDRSAPTRSILLRSLSDDTWAPPPMPDWGVVQVSGPGLSQSLHRGERVAVQAPNGTPVPALLEPGKTEPLPPNMPSVALQPSSGSEDEDTLADSAEPSEAKGDDPAAVPRPVAAAPSLPPLPTFQGGLLQGGADDAAGAARPEAVQVALASKPAMAAAASSPANALQDLKKADARISASRNRWKMLAWCQ
eukprot:TRINITY_DN75831_c0_g1_i1.p1 TRINITY_DN75831_c0_g1~~TRINITY_DN75831_c0_g1_i1.p1  ORF type:complete len:749 (-),score=167.42 TRINITY_DN75831_c0_g1_i1:140-2386(-)